MNYKKTLGVEIHAQIATKTKLFSRALVDESAESNENVDFLDAGMPGALPSPNKAAIFMAMKTALALNMEINSVSIFDRKHYFYQDLPLGYQITQFYKPIGVKGYLDCSFGRININRLHIECDAGKSVYQDGHTYVDLNRAGVPLMEIVTDPDFENEDQVVEFLKELRSILLAVETCKCNMDMGNLRADVNLSLSKEGEPLGTRVEIKNLNSFSSIRKAVQYEAQLQEKTLKAGDIVLQETKLFDVSNNTTKSMRSKEDAVDYMYFPDPDLLPVFIEESLIEECRKNLPKLPMQIRQELQDCGVAKEQSYTLTETKIRYEFFIYLMNTISEKSHKSAEKLLSDMGIMNESDAPYSGDYDVEQFMSDKKSLYAIGDIRKVIFHPKIFKEISNWICSELIGKLAKLDLDLDDFLSQNEYFYDSFAKLLFMCMNDEITRAVAKDILDKILTENSSFDDVVQKYDLLKKVEFNLDDLIKKIVDESPKEVEKFKKGKVAIVMYFVGMVMKETKGQCNADEVKNKIEEELKKR